MQLPWLDEVVSAKASRRLLVVRTPREVRELLLQLDGGTNGLMAALLYATGLRLLEGLRLRVKDVEFERREIIVREGKGAKDRVTVLPENLIVPLRAQLEASCAWHRKDIEAGRAGVWLPDALAVKFPRAGQSWGGVGVPEADAVDQSTHRHRAQAPPARAQRAARSGRSRAPRRYRQAVLAARAAPLVCHPPATRRLRLWLWPLRFTWATPT